MEPKHTLNPQTLMSLRKSLIRLGIIIYAFAILFCQVLEWSAVQSITRNPKSLIKLEATNPTWTLKNLPF